MKNDYFCPSEWNAIIQLRGDDIDLAFQQIVNFIKLIKTIMKKII